VDFDQEKRVLARKRELEVGARLGRGIHESDCQLLNRLITPIT
jgi:hypothetical protein